MHQTIVHGRLARDPEFNTNTNKKGEAYSICRFTVASSRRNGDDSDFFPCVIFGKRAEVINKWFQKGSEIVVKGEMQCNPYEKDGVKHYPWSLNVDDFDFCGGKSKSEQNPLYEETVQQANDLLMNSDSFEAAESDIPF